MHRFGLRLSLLAQGLRYRRGIGALLVLVTALTTGTAAAAAVYRQAAADSALRARLVGAPAADSGVEVAGSASPRSDWSTQLPAKVPDLPYARSRILGIAISGMVTGGGQSLGQPAVLVWRQDDCAHLAFPVGRCPTGRGEVAVPAGAGSRTGWRLGGVLRVTDLTPDSSGHAEDINGDSVDTGSRSDPPRYRVVGRYRVPAPDDPYWLGNPPGNAAFLPDGSQVRLPALLLGRAAFARMPPALKAQVTLDQPFSGGGLSTADVPTLERGLAAIEARAGDRLTVTTQLPQLLAADAADRRVLGNVVALAAVQLLGLVGLVLVVVLALAVAGRRAELAAGALRGRRPLRVALGVLVEPAVLLAVGLAVGVVAAPAAVRLAALVWLRRGTPVHLVPAALVAAVVVGLAGAVASLVVALRAARRPAAEQLAASAPPPRRGAARWEIGTFTIALAGLVELLTAGGVRNQNTPWALLAPVLCGLAAALALARLVPLALRPLLRATDGSPHLSTFLWVRELRRDSAAWRVIAVVAVAVSLLSFAVAVSRGAAADRRDRAGLVVGAAQVVSVVPPAGLPVAAAVARLDPAGRWAMAAEQVTPFGSDAQRTLAVDAARLPAVESWSRPVGGFAPAALASALRPGRPAPFRFTTPRFALPVRVTRLTASVPLRLGVYLVEPEGTRVVRTGQRLRVGARTYSWPTPRCGRPPGCRLLSVDVQRPNADFSDYSIDLVIGGLGRGPWSVSEGQGGPVPAGWHMSASFTGGTGDTVGLVRRELPVTPLPAIIAGATGNDVTGLDGQQLSVRPIAQAAALPRLLAAGALVDLSYATLVASSADPGGTFLDDQVWLGSAAPPDALARLRGLGVTVLHVDRTDAEVRTLGYLGPAAGLDGYLAVALLAAAVAFALLAASAGVAARRRRTEYIALATAGVSTGALTRAWVAAAVVRLGFAAAAGLASGLATAHLAAPGVPLDSPGTIPVPQLGVPALPAIIATLVTLAPLVAVEVFGVRWSARRAGLRQLREAMT